MTVITHLIVNSIFNYKLLLEYGGIQNLQYVNKKVYHIKIQLDFNCDIYSKVGPSASPQDAAGILDIISLISQTKSRGPTTALPSELTAGASSPRPALHLPELKTRKEQSRGPRPYNSTTELTILYIIYSKLSGRVVVYHSCVPTPDELFMTMLFITVLRHLRVILVIKSTEVQTFSSSIRATQSPLHTPLHQLFYDCPGHWCEYHMHGHLMTN